MAVKMPLKNGGIFWTYNTLMHNLLYGFFMYYKRSCYYTTKNGIFGVFFLKLGQKKSASKGTRFFLLLVYYISNF